MASEPQRVSIPVSCFPRPTSTEPRWALRRVAGALLTLWATVAALVAAVILAVVWDLRR
jgi:hypothetical protein